MPMKNINYLFLQPTGLFFSSKFNLLHFFLENFWSSTKFVWTYIFFNFPTKNILFSGFDGKNHWFIAKKGRRFRTKIFQVIKIWFCSRPATFSRKTKRYVQDFLPLEGEEACMCCMPICERATFAYSKGDPDLQSFGFVNEEHQQRHHAKYPCHIEHKKWKRTI